jgi:hypothetical protein
MKRFSALGWVWVAALAVLSALSFTGCQTGSVWRADGPRGDTPRISEGVGGSTSVAGDRPCRFG